jgi:HD-like signal output (HDOD) protein
VLRCANSSFYLRGDEVVSLAQAITRIGAREVTRIAMASGLGGQARAPGPLHGLKRQIWHEALASAVLIQQLCRRRKVPPEAGFSCGLLHDFGRVVAAAALEEVLAQQPGAAAHPEGFWAQIIEGFHVELGSIVAARWKLPVLVADVIGHHHDGACDPSNREMVAVIGAVDRVNHLLAIRPHLSAEDLAAIPELRDQAERDLVARAVPDVPAFIAAFEGQESARSPRAQGSSRLLAPETRPSAGATPFTGAVTVHLGREREACQGVRIGPQQLVIRGPSPLRENYLVQPTLAVKPPLSIWGIPKACRPQGGTYLVDVQPYALSGEALERWSALLGPPQA